MRHFGRRMIEEAADRRMLTKRVEAILPIFDGYNNEEELNGLLDEFATVAVARYIFKGLIAENPAYAEKIIEYYEDRADKDYDTLRAR